MCGAVGTGAAGARGAGVFAVGVNSLVVLDIPSY